MTPQLFGRKIGMTQIYKEDGTCLPVTVLEVGPCTIVQVKTKETDGYNALQVAFGNKKKKTRIPSPDAGHFKKAGTDPLELVGEIEWDGKEERKAGDKISVEVFDGVRKVDVSGVSKGRGWMGAIRRWGFHRQPATHGQSDRERAPGSLGRQHSISQGVYPGKRMAGHWGHEKVTTRNLDISHLDKGRNLLYVRGGVPGPNGGFVKVQKARWIPPKASAVVSKKSGKAAKK